MINQRGKLYFKNELPDMKGIYLGARVEIVVGDLFELNLPITMLAGFSFIASDEWTGVYVDMTTKESTIIKDLKRPGLAGARLRVERDRDRVRCEI